MTRTEPAATTSAAMPTLRGIEHLSMTVPDLEEATSFFRDIFGCTVMYTMGPFSGQGGSFMRKYANADVRTTVHHVRVLRSPYLNIELFAASSPVQRTRWPDALDIGGWHLAAYVDDMDAAVEYVSKCTGVYVLGDGKKPTGGPEVGEGSWATHLMSDFGLHFELLTYPNGRAYESATDRRIWNPAQPSRGAAPTYQPGRGIPGFRGFEHVSITVPDIEGATELLAAVFGAEFTYDIEGPFNRGGSSFGAYINADVRAQPTKARMLRTEFLNIELVECPPHPGQNREWPGMLDVGGWHLAAYVDDVDAALAYLETLPSVRVLGGKKPAYEYEAGPGACTVHCATQLGIYFELVCYPQGRDLEADYATPAWHPARPAG